jgi:hypothetical protein
MYQLYANGMKSQKFFFKRICVIKKNPDQTMNVPFCSLIYKGSHLL